MTLRDRTQELLDGNTEEESRGLIIKGGVEVAQSYGETWAWLLVILLLVAVVPATAILSLIPFAPPGIDLPLAGSVLVLWTAAAYDKYQRISCRWP